MTFLIMLLMSMQSAHATEPGVFGHVKVLVGEATVNDVKLKVGDLIPTGAKVKTDTKSTLKILLQQDRGAIQVGPNSEFFATSTKETEFRLVLAKGSVLSNLRKVIAPKRKFLYEIETPRASMGVRGTTFYTSIEKNNSTYQCICEGEVETRWAKGKDTKISKHHDHIRSFSGADGEPKADSGRDHSDEEINELKALLAPSPSKKM